MPSLDQTQNPENCQNMVEVREGVDAVDRALLTLLSRRFEYMEAAARIKSDRATVRDEARKVEVIGNAVAHAKEAGVSVALVADIWERLVEASIAFEFERWDEIRSDGG